MVVVAVVVVAVVDSAERHDRAVGLVVVVVAAEQQRDHRWAARRRLIVRAVAEVVLVVARRDRRLRRLGQMAAEALVVQTLATEVGQRLNQGIDRELEMELAPARDRPRCRALDREPDKELVRGRELAIVRQVATQSTIVRRAGTRSTTTESASLNHRRDCRDLEVVLLDRGCRIKEPVCRTKWRTVRNRWRIGVPT